MSSTIIILVTLVIGVVLVVGLAALRALAAATAASLERNAGPSDVAMESAAMIAVKRHAPTANVIVDPLGLRVDGALWVLGPVKERCRSRSDWKRDLDHAAQRFLAGEIVDAPETGDDDDDPFDNPVSMRIAVMRSVLPGALLVTDPRADLTDESVPGARFCYVVPMDGRAPLLRPAALLEMGVGLEELRACAVRNADLTQSSLDLAPVRRDSPLMTNRRDHMFAAALLLDDGFWRARFDEQGPLVAAATAPTRILFGPDTPEVRSSIARIVDAAPSMEDEMCMETVVRYDGTRWHEIRADGAADALLN